jgi:hypothetical protein
VYKLYCHIIDGSSGIEPSSYNAMPGNDPYTVYNVNVGVQVEEETEKE